MYALYTLPTVILSRRTDQYEKAWKVLNDKASASQGRRAAPRISQGLGSAPTPPVSGQVGSTRPLRGQEACLQRQACRQRSASWALLLTLQRPGHALAPKVLRQESAASTLRSSSRCVNHASARVPGQHVLLSVAQGHIQGGSLLGLPSLPVMPQAASLQQQLAAAELLQPALMAGLAEQLGGQGPGVLPGAGQVPRPPPGEDCMLGAGGATASVTRTAFNECKGGNRVQASCSCGCALSCRSRLPNSDISAV